MAGGGKGPSSSGTITQNTVNPTQQAQLPFLQFGWGNAQNLFNTDPFQYYPGQTLANFNPAISQGYQGLIGGAYSNDQTLRPAGNNLFFNAANGGYNIQNSPVYQQLMNEANGNYLTSNNPMFNAAMAPVIRAYQTATAPGTSGSFESAGRYGSGSMANAVSQNQQDLGSTLNNLSAQIYGQERGLQNAAMGTVQSGFQSGNQLNNQALALMPSVLNAQFIDPQQEIAGGQGLTSLDQAQIQDAMNRFYGTQEAPWKTLQTFMNSIGQPTSGSSSTTSPLLGPSPLSSMLALAGGANSLFGNNGLFSGGGALGGKGGSSAINGGLTDFGGGGAALGIPDVIAPEIASSGGKGLSSFLPFAFG